MRSLLVGSCTSAAWVLVSLLVEGLFPLGDWRWAIAAAVLFTPTILEHVRGLRDQKMACGYRRAGHIMRALTMKKAEKLFEDYSRHEESRIAVCAAYSLRLWRHGTEDSAQERAKIEEFAIHSVSDKNFDSVKISQVEEEFKYAKSKLKNLFPERRWSKWMRQLRELREA